MIIRTFITQTRNLIQELMLKRNLIQMLNLEKLVVNMRLLTMLIFQEDLKKYLNIMEKL